MNVLLKTAYQNNKILQLSRKYLIRYLMVIDFYIEETLRGFKQCFPYKKKLYIPKNKIVNSQSILDTYMIA